MTSPNPKVEEATKASDHLETIEMPEKTAQHLGAADEQTNQYAGATAVPIDKATNRRLFWMINRRILAIQLVTYFCQGLDKGTVNFASIMGIKDDAHLVGQEVRKSAQNPKTASFSLLTAD
jgi:hypothetical protein